jgi:hypothetical protein
MAKVKPITFAVCNTAPAYNESPIIVNTDDEAVAYHAVMGKPYPKKGPKEQEEWQCFFAILQPGEALSTERY